MVGVMPGLLPPAPGVIRVLVTMAALLPAPFAAPLVTALVIAPSSMETRGNGSDGGMARVICEIVNLRLEFIGQMPSRLNL